MMLCVSNHSSKVLTPVEWRNKTLTYQIIRSFTNMQGICSPFDLYPFHTLNYAQISWNNTVPDIYVVNFWAVCFLHTPFPYYELPCFHKSQSWPSLLLCFHQCKAKYISTLKLRSDCLMWNLHIIVDLPHPVIIEWGSMCANVQYQFNNTSSLSNSLWMFI